jgi:hypothetical protein
MFMGLSFTVLVPAARIASTGTLVTPAFLLGAYLLSAIGELCLSPVGLSTFSAVAPQRVIGQAMGVWFLSMALGNLTAGRILGLVGQVSPSTFALGMALVVLGPLAPRAGAADDAGRPGRRAARLSDPVLAIDHAPAARPPPRLSAIGGGDAIGPGGALRSPSCTTGLSLSSPPGRLMDAVADAPS